MAKLIDTSYEASPVEASPAKAKPVKVKPVKVKPAKQEPTTTNSRSTNSRGTNSRGIDPLRRDSEWAQSWAKETRDKAQHTEAKAETEVKPTSTGASGKTFTMPFTPKIVTTNNSRNIDPMKQNAEWARSWAKGVHDEAASAKAEAAAKEKRAELLSVYGDTSKKSATDIFKTTEGGTGGYYGSQHTEELREQLNRFHDKELMPSYSNYQQILKDYNAGKATAAQLEEARLDYASKYYQYAPLYGAYETLRRGNIAVNGDSATLRDSFDRWGAASTAAENAVTASGERLAQLRADYEKELAAYQADPSSGRDKLTEAGLKYEEAAGKYNADLFVLQEIVELTGLLGRQSNRAAEREQKEYYDAHPYALRADDTAGSIAERTATLKADYEAAESAMQAAGRKYTADYDAEAFGVGAGYSDAAKAAYDSAREAYDAARLNYERMQALNDWASDPAHLESRDNWTRNGWTWDDRFFEYQQTGDKSVLDDLVYGYGAFMADDGQRAELTQVLTRQFKEAKANRIPDSATVSREVRDEAEALYREAQDRLHMVGGVATSARDLADAAFWTVVTDIASIGSLALDATTLAVQAFAPETARWMQNWSNGIKADRVWAQEQMSREVANMPYAGAMAVQLVPSVLECIGSAWYAKFLQGASALSTSTSLAAIAQYETNVAKASNWANVIQASMQDMARNPQYWTSFARVAGTDYVDAVNDGASQMQAMAYALADGSLNALIEIGGGGIQSLPQVSEELTNPTVRKVLREVYLKSVFDEGMEEVYQGVVERGLSAMLLGSGNKLVGLTDSEEDREAIFSFVSALEEFAGGAAVSAIVSSPTAFTKMLEGGKREANLRAMNTENLALPEDLRLTPLDVQTCTDNEAMDFYLTLQIRKLQNSIINESEDNNAAHQTERAAATSYYEEVQQRAEQANPDKSILSPIATELQEKGYGDAVKAQEQAELLGKVLDGETLTDAEVRAFELNNDLVRTVFRERTGLTGMPETGDLDAKARRVYIDAARTMANRVKAAQAALAETIAPKTTSKPMSTVAEAQTGSEAASNAAEAISNTPEQVSAFRRRAQKVIRERNVRRREAELQKQNQRQRPINTEGKSTDEVIRLVRRQSGSDQILTREEFDRVRPATLTSSDEEAKALARLDQAGRYYWYLTNELGLTRAEADAVVRSQRLTDAAAETYTESENVKEEESNGGREAGSDVGGIRETGGQDGALEHDGTGGGSNEAAGGEVSGAGSVFDPDAGSSGEGTDAARETSDGRVTPSFSEAAEGLVNRYHNERIREWTDAPVSQLSEAEASAFAEVGAWVDQLAGARVYLLNTKGKGVGLEVAEDLETQRNGKTVKLPPPIARGEFDTTDGVMRILVAADLTRTRGFSPTRTLTHEGLHALFEKFGNKELRGELRAKTMANMTLLKGYNAFKSSPDGEPYAAAYKGRESVIHEEYVAKVFAHQYGTEAEQKLIAEFIKDNIPGFPIEEYTKQMKALDELYAAPKTVEQAIERKPAPPEALPAPAPGALPAKQESTPAKPRVSKAARELAERFDVDLTQVRGTGKNGSITKADVQRYRAAQAAAPKAETPKTEAPKPISVKPNTAKTEEAKTETPKPISVKPNTAKTEEAKTETPKPIRVAPNAQKINAPRDAKLLLSQLLDAAGKDSSLRKSLDTVLADESLSAQMQADPAKALAAAEVCRQRAEHDDASDRYHRSLNTTRAKENGFPPRAVGTEVNLRNEGYYKERRGEFEIKTPKGETVPYEVVVDDDSATARRKDGRGKPVTVKRESGSETFENEIWGSDAFSKDSDAWLWQKLREKLGEAEYQPWVQPPWPRHSWSVTIDTKMGSPETYELTENYAGTFGTLTRKSDGQTITTEGGAAGRTELIQEIESRILQSENDRYQEAKALYEARADRQKAQEAAFQKFSDEDLLADVAGVFTLIDANYGGEYALNEERLADAIKGLKRGVFPARGSIEFVRTDWSGVKVPKPIRVAPSAQRNSESMDTQTLLKALRIAAGTSNGEGLTLRGALDAAMSDRIIGAQMRADPVKALAAAEVCRTSAEQHNNIDWLLADIMRRFARLDEDSARGLVADGKQLTDAVKALGRGDFPARGAITMIEPSESLGDYVTDEAEQTKTKEAEKSDAPKPTRVRPNTPDWRNETVPNGLTREQAKRIPEELRPAATPEERLDRFAHELLGRDIGRTVAPEKALQGDTPAAKEARRLYNATNADIVFVTGEGDARSNRYIRNGSPDVRLREGWSFVTVSDKPEIMLQRVAKAIFDQLSVQMGTPTGRNKGIAKPNDMALVERVFHQLRLIGAGGYEIGVIVALSGAMDYEIAAIHRAAADTYAQQAKENGLLHDNWRDIYSTGSLDSGDRIAELRALPESERTDKDEAELERLEEREALLAQATEEELRQLRESEDQIVSYGGEDGSKPVGQVLDRKAEATMQTNFQNWADYQYIRELYAFRMAGAAMDKQARKVFYVTEKGRRALLVGQALSQLYAKNKGKSSLWSRRKPGEAEAFQKAEARQNAQLRQWCADNLWTQEPQFGKPGKDYGLVMEQLREIFSNAQKRGAKVFEYRTRLKNERDRAATLKRAIDSYKTSDVYTLSAEAEAETVAAELEGRAELEGHTDLTRERLGDEGETDIALGEEDPATGSIEELMGAAQKVELNVSNAILGELRGDADTSAYLEKEEFRALLAEERENRHIPPKPTDQKELYRWKKKYEALDEKAFLAAELRYRDLYGGPEAQMSGEEMQAELTRSYARIRELDGQLTAAEKALDNALKSWMVQLSVPAGASRYTVGALAKGVAAGQISAENALETVRRIPQQWRADNALTAEDVLHRARVDYTMTPVDVDAEVTETALHDLVEAAEDDAEAGGQKLTEQQNELLNAVAETQQTANPANEERAEMVRDLRDRGATPLNAPVGYTEKTRAYHHDPNGPRRVRKYTTSDSTGNTYTADDISFNDPYDTKAQKKAARDAAKERRGTIGDSVKLAAYSDVWGVEKLGFKQTREDNVGVLINAVRGSAETAGFIFTKGLVTPEGQLVGGSFRDAMLMLDRKGNLDVERQAKLDKYRQLLHTVDRMSIVQRAEAAVEEYLALYPELKAVSGKKLADMTRINPIAAEYARRLDWLKNAEDKPVLRTKEIDINGKPVVVSAETAQKAADEMLAADPWLAKKAQETYDWWDMFMRLYVVGGTVSEADYNNLRAAYPHYIPTHREDMPGPLAKEFQRAITSWSESISAGPGLKEAKGSTKDIRGIPDQQAILVAAYVKAYRVRELCNNIIDELLVDDAGNFREFGHIVWEKTDPLYKEAHEDAAGADGAVVEKSKEGHYLLTTFRNGKRVTAELSPMMFTSLKNLLGLQSDGYKKMLRWGSKFTSPMKAMITGANINFAVRNLAGDIPTALINTKNKDLQYSRAWLAAWEHIMRNSDEWLTFQALGGTHSNYMHLDKGFVKAATKGRSIGGKVFDIISTPGEISESVTRFAEYLATVRTRGDDYTSRLIGVHRSAEVTVDFSRAGSWARAVNAWVPYFNPAVQGVAKVFRSVFEEKSVKSAVRTLRRAAAASVLPELFMALLRKIMDKEEEFNEVSDYVKDNYYLIPMDDHKWFRIRKNREWAAVFGNTLMRLFEGATGYERPFETYLDISILGNFLPDVPKPILIDQLLQLAGNENYAGSVIIPSSFDDFKERVPMAVYDEDTSALAYTVSFILSRVWSELNPMAVDYLLHSYFGDFFSNFYDFFTLGDIEHYKEDGFDFLELAEDSLLSFWGEEKKAWVTDSRYSNSTVTRYYEMYGDLKANVASEKYLNGGAIGSREEEILAALSNQRYGYSALIQTLSKEARSMPDGEEKAEIKGQIVLLARLANDFYERCMAGEISDPVRYIKYHRFGSVVCDELVRLGEAEDGYDPESFNFDPTFSCPAYLRDPSNSDKQYTLSGNEELREQFIALQEENYGKAVEKLVLSSEYQKLSKSAQAAALEQQRSIVLAETKEEFLKYLKKQGVKSADRTLASVELAQLEAKYALQRVNSPDTAVSEKVSGELVRLEKYTSEYSFVLSTSVPKTFRDQTDSKRVYTLTPHQQDYYDRERSALYNEALSTVIASSKYRKASDEEKAAMLEAAGSIVDKQLRKEFQSYLDRVGARSALRTTLDDELITEAAGYAVTEILSPDDAYDRKVTDELLRLYGLSNDYSFQPPTNKRESYVDPKNRSKEYVLTEEQQMAYVRLSREVYNDAVLTIITDPSYAQLTDAQKAERLNAMRSSLAAEVKDRFLLWLSQNTTSTDREADKVSKETKRYIKSLLGW